MKVFSGSSNKSLAEKVARQLNTSLSPLDIYIFPDGEKRIRVIDKVVDEDCAVVQSTSTPANENYMELFFIVDALKRSGARSITGIVPYLGYQRQDHVFRDGEAVSLEVIIKTLEAVGLSKLITFDLHSIKIPELFSVPVVHLSALPIFAEKIKEIVGDARTFDIILISPDMGGIRRIKILSGMLSGMPYVSIVKNRDLATGKVEAQSVESDFLNWEKAHTAFVADDMISTGATIEEAVSLLIEKGIKEIYVFATHPVFSNDCKNILQNSRVRKIFVTDTIDVPEEKRFDKLEIISISQTVTKELKN